jgi:hypothetical protein
MVEKCKTDDDAKQLVRQLILKPGATGFERLFLANRLDLSVEHIVVEYGEQFGIDEHIIKIAKRTLKK